jgi:hypothetical protein
MIEGVEKFALVSCRSKFGGCLYVIMVEQPSNTLLILSDLVFLRAWSISLGVCSCEKLPVYVETKMSLFCVLSTGLFAGPWSFA